MKILYATDGSDGGQSAGHFLAALAPGPETHVHIVTALPGKSDAETGTDIGTDIGTDTDTDTDTDTESDTESDDRGAALLAAARAALGDFSGPVTAETLRLTTGSTGDVAETLLGAAERHQADLIVLGANGRSAVATFFLGSVAESVARHARCPVLLARPPAAPLREILVGVDGSDGSRAAAEFVARRLPLPLLCRLRLVRVVGQPVFGLVGDPLYPGTPDYIALERANRKARQQASAETSALADTLRQTPGGPGIEVEDVPLGHPATELIRLADEHSAGLIVVGSQGLTKMARFLLGSVSERVMRHAHCSVLIVKE